MNLEYFAVPESKEMLKIQKDKSMSRTYRNEPERAHNSQSWNNLNNKNK